MTTFESLYELLETRRRDQPDDSRTVELLAGGTAAIGAKLCEEAAEAWLAAEHESADETAAEVAQVLYHGAVLAVHNGLTLDDLLNGLPNMTALLASQPTEPLPTELHGLGKGLMTAVAHAVVAAAEREIGALAEALRLTFRHGHGLAAARDRSLAEIERAL